MDDKQCLIYEFTNESRKIAVGFREWLIKKITDSELKEIINEGKEVTLQWPKDVDVGPVATMRKKIDVCSWLKTTAKILAYGGKYIKTFFKLKMISGATS